MRYLVLLCVLLMVACTPSALQFPGQSYASNRLKLDTLRSALPMAMMKAREQGCQTRRYDVVESQITRPLSPEGRWQELWTVKLCNILTPLVIDFNRTADGGTDFAVHYQNTAQ